MDTKALDKIQALRRNATAFETFWEAFRKCIADPRVDKHTAGFNADNRFRSFGITVGFDNCTGIYGSSSCSTFMSCDSALANEYLTKALNVHSEAIFATIGKLMRADAAKLTADAEKEIERLQKLISEANEAA